MAIEIRFKGFKPSALLKSHVVTRLQSLVQKQKKMGANIRLTIERIKEKAAAYHQCRVEMNFQEAPAFAFVRVDANVYDTVNNAAVRAHRDLERYSRRYHQTRD